MSMDSVTTILISDIFQPIEIKRTSKGRVGPSSGSSSVDIGKKLKEKNKSKISGRVMSSAGFGGIVLNPKLSHAIIMVMVKITLHTLHTLLITKS